MSKFQTLYKKKLSELQPKTADSPRQDLLITVGKLFGGAILVFTFLSGVIFTVIPLARNISLHFQTHILEPIVRWMAAEPTTGNSLMFLIYATISAVILYILRDKIQILFLWILASGERSAADAAHKIEQRRMLKELEEPFGAFESKASLIPTRQMTLEPADDKHPLF